MKVIFKPSKYDDKNIYHLEVEAEESVIVMRNRIRKINQRALKKGARYTYICREQMNYYNKKIDV